MRFRNMPMGESGLYRRMTTGGDRNDEQNKEDDKQDSGDFRREACNADESQNPRHERDK